MLTRSRLRWLVIIIIITITIGALAPSPLIADRLQPGAAAGFTRYVQLTEERMQLELRPNGAFLWIDALTPERRREAETALRRGEIVTDRIETRDPAGLVRLPGALIHHWVGLIFVPKASLDQVLRTVQDYDHHQRYYSPQVLKSKLLQRTGDDFKVYLRLKQVKVITVVMDTEHEVHYARLDKTRAQSRAYATHIAEVEHPGEKNERGLPAGNDHGFLWRLNSYWRFSATPDGVYVQCEAISLSRDVPAGLDALIGPFLETIPKQSLEFTLRATRSAVLAAPQAIDTVPAPENLYKKVLRTTISNLTWEATNGDNRNLLDTWLARR
jgi:hypothetical protein